MPAFGMAVAYGMPEIEFDVRFTKDNVPVACHDRALHHYSDVQGNIEDLTWDEIRVADCGSKFNPIYAGTRLPLFEEICAPMPTHSAPMSDCTSSQPVSMPVQANQVLTTHV